MSTPYLHSSCTIVIFDKTSSPVGVGGRYEVDILLIQIETTEKEGVKKRERGKNPK